MHKTGATTPLQVWYEENSKDVADFEKQMRRKVHYVVKPEFLWDNITHLARTQSDKLLRHATEGIQVHRGSFRSPATSRGCSRRSTSARTSSAGSTTTATPSSARSSARSPGGWRFLDGRRHAGGRVRVPDRAVRGRVGEEGGRVLHAAADFEHPLRHRHARQPGAEDRHAQPAGQRVRLRLRVGVAAAERAPPHGAARASARSTGRRRTSRPTTWPA